MRNVPEKFVEISLQRERVSIARSLLKDAREQAHSAKVRRKLAKLLAKRAVEGAKQAKANLEEAERDLERAEALVSLSRGDNGHAAKRKTKKSTALPRAKRLVARARRKNFNSDAVIPVVISLPEPVSSPVISEPAA